MPQGLFESGILTRYCWRPLWKQSRLLIFDLLRSILYDWMIPL